MPRAVVVIDVLRAFTTAAYASRAGASAILLATDVAAAQSLRASMPRAVLLSDGERREGVELVNSPALISDAPVRGRPLIMTTTNGTRAALEADPDVLLLCASFVNAGATASLLRDLGIVDVDYVASGGRDADEDVACGEYIDATLRHGSVAAPPFLERVWASTARDVLDRRVSAGDTGVHADDVGLCAQADSVPLALVGVRALGTVMLVAQPSPTGAAFNC